MKNLESALFALTVLTLIAVIWMPGFWLQLGLTALVLFLTACGVMGQRLQDNQPTLNRAGRRQQSKSKGVRND